MYFRMYLLDAEEHIRAAHPFSEASDAEAMDIGKLLYSSCDDVFKGYEVWRGPTMICQSQNLAAGPKETLAEVSERRQRLFVEMEEIIMASFSCVRSSRKLLKEMEALKERLDNPKP